MMPRISILRTIPVIALSLAAIFFAASAGAEVIENAARLKPARLKKTAQEAIVVQSEDLAGAEITVQLKSGHTLTATLDPQSSRDRLWLRWENAAAVIQQQIDWGNVSRVGTLEEEYSAEEFRLRLPKPVDVRLAIHKPYCEPQSASRIVALSPQDNSRESTDSPGLVPQVRSLAIDARASNWNADPAVDGVQLSVYPLDASGEVVPVRGTVTAELLGDVRSLKKPQPRRRFPQYSRMGWWSRAVEPDSFGVSGATLRLPFQSHDPEFDPTVRSRTLLTVQLAVPGQGVYRASVADLWVRPFSPLRNRIEESTGRRYLPQEIRGR